MRSSNPVLNEKTFSKSFSGAKAMTIEGTVRNTFLMALCIVLTGGYTWMSFFKGQTQLVSLALIGGLIAGLIFAIATIFKKEWSPVTVPLYALAEGLALGGLSATFEQMFPGIVFHAFTLTIGTLFALLLAYQSKMIQVTDNFRMGIFAATGGIALMYIVDLLLSFFGLRMPFIHETGLLGVGISLFIVVIAALNLVLDFDFIENAAKQGAPKYMEWYGAFGLMVTLIWLYMEILRLLAKTRSRD
jgi:uncharacterized YccA/Bax inhibitor family protein